MTTPGSTTQPSQKTKPSTLDTIKTDEFVRIVEPPDPFARVPRIAARLRVGEAKKGYPGVVLRTKDGKAYSLFDLVDALLDRIDSTLEKLP